ncbi:MAG: hypothetical protein J0H39_05755 [Alphaproteobacteria bacterium]|nr:hypothetical protein [Alphaproteobacteria bacterium]
MTGAFIRRGRWWAKSARTYDKPTKSRQATLKFLDFSAARTPLNLKGNSRRDGNTAHRRIDDVGARTIRRKKIAGFHRAKLRQNPVAAIPPLA